MFAPDLKSLAGRGLSLLRILTTVLLLALFACLHGCGGGGSGGGSPTGDIQISGPPRSASASVGGTAAFTVSATGAAPLSYQWYRNGQAIAGATGATYIVQQVAAWIDKDQYQALVSNGANPTGVMSTVAVLNVNPAPGIALVAGKTGGPGNLDGVGALARFYNQRNIAVDQAGTLYLAGDLYVNASARKITPEGVVTTTSNGAASYTLLAFDAAGNRFEMIGYALWKTTPSGVRTLLAGSDQPGYADGIGAQARFDEPLGLATDTVGNVYVADRIINAIRKVTPAGLVTTLAGKAGTAGSTDGVGTAAQFYGPVALATDPAGNVYVADQGNFTVRKITPAGVVSTFAGMPGEAGAVDGTGTGARLGALQSIASDGAGTLYTTDNFCTLRKITPAAAVTTFAGVAGQCGSDDGVGATARFGSAMTIATDTGGDIHVVDQKNYAVRKVSPSGAVTTLAGNPPHPGSNDGVGATARINNLSGTLGVDAAGNIYFGYAGGLRKFSTAGVVSTLPDTGGTQDSIIHSTAVDAAGNGYAVSIGYGSSSAEIRKFSLDGKVTTLPGSLGIIAIALAVDAAGNVYVADNSNSAIRRITPDGAVSWFAYWRDLGPRPGGCADNSMSLTTDAAGNVYASWFNKVFRITPSGAIALLAGAGTTPCPLLTWGQTTPAGSIVDGTGANANFYSIGGMAADAVGNVYVTDANTVRKITPAGVVTTIAGLPSSAGVTLGSLPGSLTHPTGIAVVPGNSGTKLAVMDEYSVLSITLE